MTSSVPSDEWPTRPEFKLHSRAAGKSRRPSGRTRAFAVTTIKVEPIVWRVAMRLSGGDCRRVTVISAQEVLVRN